MAAIISDTEWWSGHTKVEVEDYIKSKLSNIDSHSISDSYITPCFGGMEIAPGPLAYENGIYVIKDNWAFTSYGSAYGKNNGSTYFTFNMMGELFEKSGFGISDNSIENILNPLNGWRLPSRRDWITIFNDRIGSTVYTSATSSLNNVTFSNVSVSDTAYYQSTISGMLLFPDYLEISGGADIKKGTTSSSLTNTELNFYLNKGCIFLPCCGHYSPNNFSSMGSYGMYGSSSSNGSLNSEYYHILQISNSSVITSTAKKDSTGRHCAIILVRDAPLLSRLRSIEKYLYTKNGSIS